MEPKDWIALAGVAVALAVSLATMRNADRQKQREREMDREDKDRADRKAKEQADRAALAEWREALLVSLLPLMRILGQEPPASGASSKTIMKYVEELRSDTGTRAVESLIYVGLVYRAESNASSVRFKAGLVQQTMARALQYQEEALEEPDSAQSARKLGAVAVVLKTARDQLRDLAEEIRGPLPGKLGLDPADDWDSTGPDSTRGALGNPS